MYDIGRVRVVGDYCIFLRTNDRVILRLVTILFYLICFKYVWITRICAFSFHFIYTIRWMGSSMVRRCKEVLIKKPRSVLERGDFLLVTQSVNWIFVRRAAGW